MEVNEQAVVEDEVEKETVEEIDVIKEISEDSNPSVKAQLKKSYWAGAVLKNATKNESEPETEFNKVLNSSTPL